MNNLGEGKDPKQPTEADSVPTHLLPKLSTATSCPLPRWELRLYYVIVITHSAAALMLAFRASNIHTLSNTWLRHWTEPSPYSFTNFSTFFAALLPSSFLSFPRVDSSDLEWKLFRQTLPDTLAVYFLHSVTFYLAVRHLSRRASTAVLVAFWLVLHTYWASWRCLATLAVHFALATWLTRWSGGRRLYVWCLSMLFVVRVSAWAPFSADPARYYKEFNLYLYGALHTLNFCIHIGREMAEERGKRGVAESKKPFSLSHVIAYLEYALYPMYSTALIVLYPDFRSQMDALRARVECGKSRVIPAASYLLWKAARLAAWFLAMEAAMHLLRVNALLSSPHTLMAAMNNYEVMSVAYTAGQLFHVKYVLIFGVPSLFAELDGLRGPPGSPICISRVARYSQMWRYFDRGLYAFLKQQVYLPLMLNTDENNDGRGEVNRSNASTSNSLKRFGAMLIVFLFVLLWHGLNPNFACWVLLSALELCIERIATDFIRTSTAYRWLVARLTPAQLWRLKSAGMLFTVIPGIFGVFFFLSRSDVGLFVFRRVLVAGFLQLVQLELGGVAGPGWVLLHLFLLGYAFNNVCLSLEGLNNHTASAKKCERDIVGDKKQQ